MFSLKATAGGVFLSCCLAAVSVSAQLESFEDPTPREARKQKDEDPIEKLQERFANTVRAYKPVYIAYGHPDTKLQFSFRSELSDVAPVNFAYSQIIFWQLGEDSKPFRDATYTPEFFYRWSPSGDRWSAVDFGIWEHNSNGKAGADSRSYDQSYVRGIYSIHTRNFLASFALKLRLLYNYDEENGDIQDYIGPFDLDIRLIGLFDFLLDQSEVIFNLRPGGKFGTETDKGGYQISAKCHIRGLKINPAFYIQYYQGYAETLINYQQRVSEFRVGFVF
ncbi:MAG: phospholipase A [Bdellovibrio sp.]